MEDGRPVVRLQIGTPLADAEKTFMLATLNEYEYNRTHTANVLNIGVRTLQRALKRWGIPKIGLKDNISDER